MERKIFAVLVEVFDYDTLKLELYFLDIYALIVLKTNIFELPGFTSEDNLISACNFVRSLYFILPILIISLVFATSQYVTSMGAGLPSEF